LNGERGIKTSYLRLKAYPFSEELNDFIDQQYAMLQDDFCRRIGDYLLKVSQKPDPLENAVFILVLRHIDLRTPVVAQWRNYLAKKTAEPHPVRGPGH